MTGAGGCHLPVVLLFPNNWTVPTSRRASAGTLPGSCPALGKASGRRHPGRASPGTLRDPRGHPAGLRRKGEAGPRPPLPSRTPRFSLLPSPLPRGMAATHGTEPEPAARASHAAWLPVPRHPRRAPAPRLQPGSLRARTRKGLVKSPTEERWFFRTSHEALRLTQGTRAKAPSRRFGRCRVLVVLGRGVALIASVLCPPSRRVTLLSRGEPA